MAIQQIHTRFQHLLKHLGHKDILLNAAAMLGSTFVTSGLGFVYWWAAAHLFTPRIVGLASAYISAMSLIGPFGVLGLGTLLMGKLPTLREKRGSYVVTSLLVSSIVAGLLGMGFAIIAPFISKELAALAGNVWTVVLFGIGVSLAASTFVLDQAMIGLSMGGLQVTRNAAFSMFKLALLLVIAYLLKETNGLLIYATWQLSQVISIAVFMIWGRNKGVQPSRWREWRPRLSILRELPGPALEHHALNMALQITGLGLPVVVTSLLSAELNASFYLAWLIVSFMVAVPLMLSVALFASGSADKAAFSSKIRATLKLSLAAAVLANLVFWPGADFVMGLFGRSYAHDAAGALRILGLGIIPLVIKDHFIAARRVYGVLKKTALLAAVGGALELGLAALGARWGGLQGLCLGWLIALCIEGLVTGPAVYRVVRNPSPLKRGL